MNAESSAAEAQPQPPEMYQDTLGSPNMDHDLTIAEPESVIALGAPHDHDSSPPNRYQQWVEARGEHRRFLFGESVELSGAQPAEAAVGRVSLSSLLGKSKLGRLTCGAGIYTAVTRYQRDEINMGVHAILQFHNNIASAGGDAIFGLVKPPEQKLEQIATLTSRMVLMWERTWERHHKQNPDNPSPFAELPIEDIEPADFEREDVQLIVETAAAVTEILQSGYTANPGSSYVNRLANCILRYGPDYATRWIRGDIIRAHCAEHGYDAQAWLHVFTKTSLARIMVDYSQDPMGIVEKVVNNFYGELSNDNLRAWTGFDEDEIAATFNTSTRRLIATSCVKGSVEDKVKGGMKLLRTELSDETLIATFGRTFSRWKRLEAIFANKQPTKPLARLAKRLSHPELQHANIATSVGWSMPEVAALFTENFLLEIADSGAENLSAEVSRVAANYEHRLSTASLVTELGYDDATIDKLFPLSRRARLALRENPVASARNIAKLAHQIAAEEKVSLRLAAKIAFDRPSPDKAQDLVEQIRIAQTDRPPDISEAVWSSKIAAIPRKGLSHWLQMVADYRLWLVARAGIKNSTSIYAVPTEGSQELLERTRTPHDMEMEPSMMLLPNDALERVQGFVAQGHITTGELQVLLEHFARAEGADGIESAENNPKLAPILHKLKKALDNER